MEILGDSTVTGKYQVTVPKSVRERLKLDNGDLLVFVRDHDNVVVKKGTVKIAE